MKTSVTFLALFLFTITQAQRVQYSPPEAGYKAYASYNIIGHVGDHNLIFIKGKETAEIAVYDNAMQKLASVPANILKFTANKVDFFAYPDHFLAFFQYRTNNTLFCSVFKGDADGHVVEGPVVLDSIPYAGNFKKRYPSDIVLRSEDQQRYMLVKALHGENGEYHISTVLYDRDLEIQERSACTFTPPPNFSEYSEFILDNDGDLAFISTGRDDEGERVRQANLLIKPRGADSLFSKALTGPGMEFEDLKIKADNANHRYILTSFYYAKGEKSLTGLCALIWNKPEKNLSGPQLYPLPQNIRTEATKDFSSPSQILDYYYQRQILVRADGEFMVFAELFYETSVLSTMRWRRDDFIRGKRDTIFAPPKGFIAYQAREHPGYWSVTPATPNEQDGYKGFNRSTENVLVFFLDKTGATNAVKVIRKDEFNSLVLFPLSYQTFITRQDIHLIYNEQVKGSYLPAITTIRADGTMEQGQLLHDLDKGYLFLPQYGRQVGPNTMIIPCVIKGALHFARIEF